MCKNGQGDRRVSRMGEQKHEGKLRRRGDEDAPRAHGTAEALARRKDEQQKGGLQQGARRPFPREKDGGRRKVRRRPRKAGAQRGARRPQKEKRRGLSLRQGEVEQRHPGSQRKKRARRAQGGQTKGKVTHIHLGFFTRV